jgi:ribonuclease I
MARTLAQYPDSVDPDEDDDDTDVDAAPIQKVYRQTFQDGQNERVTVMRQRYRKGLDLFTGKPLDAKAKSELREVRANHCGGNAPRNKPQRTA